MKKIINMNLSGRVIPIEDSAYESLQRYIESLRRYFAAEEGRDEIINDIESRLAELMNNKIKKGAEAITDADMEEIITSMGRIEDFERADAAESTSAEQTSGAYTQAGESRSFRKRLYRDTSDKLLGGVCSGIANYMNFDPAVVRLLFAIITFGGFGFGFLIYIILWIILPAHQLDTYSGKRLFRNPDDRVIGGVAGGLSAYFKIQPWVVRLVFAGPLLINIVFGFFNGIFFAFHRGDMFPSFFIGSFSGTFILAYIILWIVLPEAKSQYDKMEMRGETVDVNRIRQNVQDEMNRVHQNVQDEMNDIKTKAKAWGEEVKTSAQQFSGRAKDFANTRGKAFATEVAQTARPLGSRIFHIIGVLFKAFFLVVAGSIAFGLFIALIVLLFGGGSGMWLWKEHVLDFAIGGFWQHLFFWGTLMLFLAVPLIAFMTWLIRRIFKIKSQRHYLGYVFAGLWVIGIFCLVGLVTSIVRDTRYYQEVKQDVPVTQPANGKLIVRVNEPEVHYGGDLWFSNDDNDNRGWSLTADSLKMANINISVVKSEDTDYSINIWKKGRGAEPDIAMDRANQIQYHATFTDSVLNLGSGYTISRKNEFRGQEVLLEIKVPAGKRIRFDPSVTEELHPFIKHFNGRGGWQRYNYDVNDFNYQTNIDYVMSPSGVLIAADEPTQRQQNSDSTYEYKGTDRSALQKEYNEQKQRTGEEQRHLKELEKQLQGTNFHKDELRQEYEEQKQKVQDEQNQLRELEQRMKNEKAIPHKASNEEETTAAFLHTSFIPLVI